jgi:hypothetical protein
MSLEELEALVLSLQARIEDLEDATFADEDLDEDDDITFEGRIGA